MTRAITKSLKRRRGKRQPGVIVKAEGLGDGPAPAEIAKLRLTMPPAVLGDLVFGLTK